MSRVVHKPEVVEVTQKERFHITVDRDEAAVIVALLGKLSLAPAGWHNSDAIIKLQEVHEALSNHIPRSEQPNVYRQGEKVYQLVVSFQPSPKEEV